MAKVIILEHDGGEFANQIWNYISIYAYCREKGYECKNYSFFEYAHYFNISPNNRFLDWLFFLPFQKYKKRKYSAQTRLWRKFYKILIVWPIRYFFKNQIIFSSKGINALYYLSPTAASTRELAELERSQKTIYFSYVSGGVFRNPLGINRHRNSIIEHFKPYISIEEKVHQFILPLRSRCKTLIGVHIRQGEYPTFKGGKYWIKQERVREILDEYLKYFQKKPEETYFVITSDEPIQREIFQGLRIEISNCNVGEDLFILASCDTIIGSDSTFGHFAAYYGNISHIIMKNGPMDWDYYADKNSYFRNKYFTVMAY